MHLTTGIVTVEPCESNKEFELERGVSDRSNGYHTKFCDRPTSLPCKQHLIHGHVTNNRHAFCILMKKNPVSHYEIVSQYIDLVSQILTKYLVSQNIYYTSQNNYILSQNIDLVSQSNEILQKLKV